MKVFGLHAKGVLSNMEGMGKILHGKVYKTREGAEKNKPAFREACVTNIGEASDLANLTDDESLNITVITFELVEE